MPSGKKSPAERFRDCVDAENEHLGLEDPADVCAARLSPKSNPSIPTRYVSVDASDARPVNNRFLAPGYTAIDLRDGTFRVTRAWFERRKGEWHLVSEARRPARVDAYSDGKAKVRSGTSLHGDDELRMAEFVEAILDLLATSV